MVQLAVEKVVGAGYDQHRNVLWLYPFEHVHQRNGVVFLAMDQDGIGGNVGHLPFLGGGAHQHQALGRRAGSGQPLAQLRLHVGAERKAGQRHGQAGELVDHPAVHLRHVVGFALTMVVHAFGSAHAAEVNARDHVAKLDESAHQRDGHLVVHGAAEQRVRMGHQGDAARRTFRMVEYAFDDAGSAGQGEFFYGHGQ